MSLNSRVARGATAAAALAALATAGASTAQAAQSSSLNYKCKFPIVGTQPLKLDLTAEPTGTATSPQVALDGTLTVGGSFATGLGLIDGLKTLVGASEVETNGRGSSLGINLIQQDGSVTPVRAPLTIEPYGVDLPVPDPVLIDVSALTPPLPLTQPGPYAGRLRELVLNLRGLDAEGNPIAGMITPSRGLDGITPFVDIDRQPGQSPLDDPTFNVPCQLDPPSQDNLLFGDGSVQPTPDTAAPSTPGLSAVQPGDVTSTSAYIRWSASTDGPTGSGVKEYIVTYTGPDGPVEKRVAASGTALFLSDLTPSTTYGVKIRAVDNAGNISGALEFDVTTTAVEIDPRPTSPAAVKATTTTDSATITWSASSDEDGTVVRYDVYQDGTKVTSTTGLTTTVTGLAAGTFYDFKVVAIDNDGRESLPSATTRARTQGGSTGGGEPTSTIAYKCKFPLIGVQPVTLELTEQLPDNEVIDDVTDEHPILAKVKLGGTAGPALNLVEGLRYIEGVNTPSPAKGNSLFTHLLTPIGYKANAILPLTLDRYTVDTPAASPVVLEGVALTPRFTLEDPGTHKLVLDRFQLNLRGLDANGQPVQGMVTPAKGVDGVSPFVDTDREPGTQPIDDPTFNVPCVLNPAVQDLEIAEFDGIVYAAEDSPQRPGPATDYVASDFTPTSINLRWSYPAGEPNPKEFKITYEGPDGALKTVRVPGDQRSAKITGLASDAEYLFGITAVGHNGNESEVFESNSLYTLPSGEAAFPTKPTGLTATSTATTASLSWTASTDADDTVKEYRVYNGTSQVAVVTGTTATITGLTPARSYAFSVEAVDEQGHVSPRSDAVNVTTLAIPAGGVNYAVAGKTVLASLFKSELKLTGGLAGVFTPASGQFSGDLVFNEATARLAQGWLPLTAKFGFVPTGKTTGTLDGAGVLTTNTKVRIKVKELKIFGAIPLVGGNSCQTKSLSDLQLKSEPGFQPQVGGKLTGSYKISDLNGCNGFQGLVSSLVAGTGTMELGLTPKP